MVIIEKDGMDENYIFFPGGSGIKVSIGEELITCITPASPFGKFLIGKKKNENFAFSMGGSVKNIKIKIKDLF